MSWDTVKGVVIHHTVTKAPTNHDECLSVAAGITNHHKNLGYHDDQGNLAIAYNYLVCPHGRVVSGRGLNSTNDANGCAEENRAWVAIALMGTNPFVGPYEKRVRLLIADVEDRFGITADVIGHREVECASTSCPGDRWQKWADEYVKEDDVLTPEDKAWIRNEVVWCVMAVYKGLNGNAAGTRLTEEQQAQAQGWLDAFVARTTEIPSGGAGATPEQVKAAVREVFAAAGTP